MNEVLKSLTGRRSCRSYLPDPIPQETLDLILEAGTYAATGMGKQSPIIIAVTDKAVRDELSAMNAAVMGAERDPFYGAPVVIAVLADKNIPTYKYDGSLVIGNLMNAAHALGLGIEGDYEGIGHCILGYPAAPAQAPAPRKENYIYRI